MNFQPVYIASVPRSGSTVLTNMLDQFEDVLCLPETFFPGVLECVTDEEWRNRRWMAALFQVSCSDGSPLDLDEAESCIRGDKQATMNALAEKVAMKSGRDPSRIRTVVWKFTRMVGCWHFAAATGGKFIVLIRNPLNVFESQFRVPFGEKNRNPLRFALFACSYESAFSRYPDDITLRIGYPDIPGSMESITTWIGSEGIGRDKPAGSMGELSGRMPWHTEINRPFDNRDAGKLRNLSTWQVVGFKAARAALTLLPWLPRMAREAADRRQMDALRYQARELLTRACSS